MMDGSVVVWFGFVVWFLRKIRPTQHWVELGCGKKSSRAGFLYLEAPFEI